MAASMTPDELLQRVCESNDGYLRLGNESFGVAGATFVRNRRTPRRRDANHVGKIRTDALDQVDALIKLAEDEFDGIPHRSFGIDPLTPRRRLHGWRWRRGIGLLKDWYSCLKESWPILHSRSIYARYLPKTTGKPIGTWTCCGGLSRVRANTPWDRTPSNTTTNTC